MSTFKYLPGLTLFLTCTALAGGGGAPLAGHSLLFNTQKYQSGHTTVDGKVVNYRAYTVVYVAKPVDTRYQSMNIFIPEAYFKGQSVGKYNAASAPIFFPNSVGGYMPGEPAQVTGGMMGPGATGPNAIQTALSRGYVVAAPGARGRTNKAADGTFYGKAPAAIVDLKAAVAYLHYNDARMPGNAERIISNGTSAGGALSALLGASGNNHDYDADLRALGAAPARTDIYAVSAYCPITNLEHADAAYEWEFGAAHNYEKLEITRDTSCQIQRKTVKGTLTLEQITLSNRLKPQFAPYVNSLGLTYQGQPLQLDAQGNGSFKNYLSSKLQESAQQALDSGQDLSQASYVTIQNKKVMAVDYDAYIKSIGRMKIPPAFDGLSYENGENQEFGTATVDNQHFTAFGMTNSKVAAKMADPQIIKMMNPMAYIATPGTRTAAFWRIRAGTADKDTSHAISALLAAKLSDNGAAVDYALPWNVPHSGDYDLPELFAWMDRVVSQ